VEGGVPQQRLDEVLQLERLDTGERNPFVNLDVLYRHVLKHAPNPDNDPRLVIKWILSVNFAIVDGSGSGSIPATFWREFLEDGEGQFRRYLSTITALLSVPPSNDTTSGITIYHKSLIDFLSSPTRCGDLYVNEKEYNCFIADRIVVILRGSSSIYFPKFRGAHIQGTLALGLGSAPPLHPPTKDLFGFLRYFCKLKLFTPYDPMPASSPGAQVLEDHPHFLFYLSEGSKAELALCDVASWTNVLLTRTIFGDGSSYGFSLDDSSVKLLGSIYCSIHKAMMVSHFEATIWQCPC
jgi:hypothetical protein